MPEIKLEWSRWVVVGGTHPGDVPLCDYTGPVVFQRRGGEGVEESGESADGRIVSNGFCVKDMVRWKPAPCLVVAAGGTDSR